MWLQRFGSILCWCSLVFGMTSTRADDTELFIYDFNKAGDFRPKVLLVFDNSGSMRDTMEQIKEAYNPATVYPLEIPSFFETQIIPSVRVYKRCCFSR